MFVRLTGDGFVLAVGACGLVGTLAVHHVVKVEQHQELVFSQLHRRRVVQIFVPDHRRRQNHATVSVEIEGDQATDLVIAEGLSSMAHAVSLVSKRSVISIIFYSIVHRPA